MNTGGRALHCASRGSRIVGATAAATCAFVWCMASSARGFLQTHKQSGYPILRTASTRSHRTFVNSDARKVLLPIGDGSEEIESVTIADVLVRAGAQVTIASVMPSLEVYLCES